jgi:hypothetical protein
MERFFLTLLNSKSQGKKGVKLYSMVDYTHHTQAQHIHCTLIFYATFQNKKDQKMWHHTFWEEHKIISV